MAQLSGDSHPSPPVLSPASASSLPAAARRGLVGLPHSVDAWHSCGGAERIARACDSRPCSSLGRGSQDDRRQTSSRSSCRSARRQRARPSIADGRELDSDLRDDDSTYRTGASIRRLYIEGSGGDLGPHSFIRWSQLSEPAYGTTNFMNAGVVLLPMMLADVARPPAGEPPGASLDPPGSRPLRDFPQPHRPELAG